MDRFVHRQNIAHYRRLLAEPTAVADQGRYKEIIRLLADEMARDAVVLDGSGTAEGDRDEQG